MFQKNLVVWKLNLYGIEIFACLMFQKNLVVWKHDGIWFCNTTLLISFQKNLVVWKQIYTQFHLKNPSAFQKNLVVWKPYHAIDFSYV